MDLLVVWITGVAGLIALAVRMVLGDTVPKGDAVRVPLVSLAMAAVGWLIALPATPPFHPGQGLGWGFAVGALAAAAAITALARSTAQSSGDRILSAGAVLGAGLAGMAGLLIALRPDRVDAITGMLLGWLIVAWLSVHQDQTSLRDVQRRVMASATLGVMSAGMASLLGVFRGATLMESFAWTSAALIVLVGASAGCVLVGLAFRTARAGPSDLLPALGVTLTSILAAWIAATRLTVSPWGDQPMAGVLWCTLIGLGVGWVLRLTAAGQSPGTRHMTSLIAVAAAVPGYRLLSGFGIAVVGLAVSAMAISAASRQAQPDESGHDGADRMMTGPVLLIALAAMRLITERHGAALRPFVLSEHYALIALLLGVFVPQWIAALAGRSTGLLYGFATAMLCVVWPLGIMVIWGAKTVLAALLGLGLASALAAADNSRGTVVMRPVAVASLIGIVAPLQFAPWALRLSELTRLERAQVAAVVGAACVLAIVLAEVARRRTSRAR